MNRITNSHKCESQGRRRSCGFETHNIELDNLSKPRAQVKGAQDRKDEETEAMQLEEDGGGGEA